MSKPPSGVNLKEWPAHDADWFKVAYWGQLNETTWATYNKDFVSPQFNSTRDKESASLEMGANTTSQRSYTSTFQKLRHQVIISSASNSGCRSTRTIRSGTLAAHTFMLWALEVGTPKNMEQ